jgi:hypothetical protein
MTKALVQILLPLADNQGNAFSKDAFQAIQTELSDRFGGLTAYTRAPARGIWTKGADQAKDDIVVIEVMIESIDADWWKTFKARLERELRQEEVVIRAQDIILL